MKTPQVIKKFLENWPVKIICLVLALFIYAFYQMSTLDSKTLSLPLNVISDGSMIQSTTITHYVRISVKGRTEDLIQITESDFTVFLDLNHYTDAGMYNVPVSVVLSENAVKINPLEFSCSPENIEVKLEPRITMYAQVEPLFTGALIDGYAIDSVSIEPDFIEISGPESMVQKTVSLQTKEISLEQKNSNFTKTVELIQRNKFITIEGEETVNVTISVSPIIVQNTFVSSLGVFAGVPAGFRTASSFPEYSVSISGPKKEMEGFVLTMYSAQIDCFMVTEEGEYQLPIKLYLPSDFTITSLSPETAPIKFERSHGAGRDN